jgi:uncharacterized repeat protein (TIGR04138 family)
MSELTVRTQVREGVERIVEKDRRFGKDSYLFVMQALDRVMRHLREPRHISAQELLNGIQTEARSQFGPMAQSVFHYWGIHESLDFGHVVFNMVHAGILAKQESDTLSDFKNDLFFERLFDETDSYRLMREWPSQAAGHPAASIKINL